MRERTTANRFGSICDGIDAAPVSRKTNMTDARTSDPRANTKVQLAQGGDALIVASGGQIALDPGAKLFSAGVDITNSLGTACIPIASGSITIPQAGLDLEIPAGYARVNIVGTSLKFAATKYAWAVPRWCRGV